MENVARRCVYTLHFMCWMRFCFREQARNRTIVSPWCELATTPIRPRDHEQERRSQGSTGAYPCASNCENIMREGSAVISQLLRPSPKFCSHPSRAQACSKILLQAPPGTLVQVPAATLTTKRHPQERRQQIKHARFGPEWGSWLHDASDHSPVTCIPVQRFLSRHEPSIRQHRHGPTGCREHHQTFRLSGGVISWCFMDT
jgi:hypothetical protein